MAGLEYTTAARRKEPITFILDDKVYDFMPEKKAGMVLDIVNEGESELKALFDWFDAGLSEEDSAAIERRLRDPEDGLDVDLLTGIIKDLLAKVSGRPTRRSSGSRRSR